MPRQRSRRGNPQGRRGGVITWVYFDKKDQERIFDALNSGIIPCKTSSKFIRENLFSTNGRHSDLNYGESCQIWITDRCDRNPNTAKTYMEYLGFGEPLIAELLTYYENRKEILKYVKEGTIDDGLSDEWYNLLFRELTGEKLKQVLMPDAQCAEKWGKRLSKQGKTWKDVMLTIPVAAEITRRMIQTTTRRHVENDAIVKRIQAWRRKQAAKT